MGNCAGKIMSNVIYFSEKFSMFLSFTLLISCSIICMICMLAFGIGLGYNYSYVDYRSKHIYIAGHHKKVRPTNYWGPGYYKPTTKDPRYTKAKRRKTTKYWWNQQRAQTKGQEPDVGEYIHDEQPEEMPNLSPVEMVGDVVAPKMTITIENRNKLETLYFSTPKSKLKPLRFSLHTNNDSTTEMTTYVSNDTTVDKQNSTEDAVNASNESDVNVMKYQKETEPITVNVTKTRDAAPPFVLKTMMHQNQLMKWLSRLQDANKTFAVHVITN